VKKAIALILSLSAAVLTTYLLFTYGSAEDDLGFSLAISIVPITCIGADYFASAQCGNFDEREIDRYFDKAYEYCVIHDKLLKHRIELIRNMRSNCFAAHKALYILSAFLAFCFLCLTVNGYMHPIHFLTAAGIVALVSAFPFHVVFPYKKVNRLDADFSSDIADAQVEERRRSVLWLLDKITPKNTVSKTDCLGYVLLGLIGGSDLLFTYSALQYNATLGICSSLIVYSITNLLFLLI
jgi:hypothetical protein